MRLALSILLLTAWIANSATYYIDYASGSDANNGTAKTTPWKRAPGMKGAAMSYSHTAGDRFIFKGGVTWPSACYQWKITWGGTQATLDYYGVDRTWFSGDAWTRPVFDLENTPIAGWGGAATAGIWMQQANWTVWEGVDIMRHKCPLPSEVWGNTTWGSAAVCLDASANNTFRDCIVRDWTQTNVGGKITAGQSGGGGIHAVNVTGANTVENCLFHQDNAGCINGAAVWNITIVRGCQFRKVASAIMSANVVRDNWIHHLVNPGDTNAHSNVALCNGGVTTTGNLIHDIPNVAQVLFYAPGYYGPGQVLCQSNTIFNVAQPCVAIDTDGLNDPGGGIRILNNTLVGPGGTGWCIRAGNRKNGPLGALEFRGNRLISTQPVSIEVAVNSLSHGNNVTNTLAQAAAAGLSAANYFGAKAPIVPPVIEPGEPPPPPAVTVTNYVTLVLTNYVTLTNAVTVTQTVTNTVTRTNLPTVFEGNVRFEGTWK